MKLYLTPLALACTLAHADITTTGTQGPWNLYAGAGTGKVLFQFPSWQQCKDAPTNPALKLKAGNYVCKSQGAVVAVNVPPPAPPPPPPPPAPPPPAPPPAPAPASASNMPMVDASKIPAPAAGFSGPRRQPAPYPFNSFASAATAELPALPVGPQSPNPSDVGAVRIGCQFSHMNFDDAIVYPGQAGVSHLHVYFGNTLADRNLASLNITQVGNSTCSGGTLNRSAYWAPAMIDTTDGSPVQPSALLVYYKTGYGGVKPADVHAVPTGLRFISGASSGNPSAPSGAGRFSCVGGDKGVGWQTTIPANCYQNNLLIMEVDFPQCWDGKNLDSPDHKSHMHEATGSGCPSSHPVALPAIAYEIYYDLAKVNLANMRNWRLSSDNYSNASPGGLSAHGDYMMGWDVDVMKTFITLCDNASKDCHANLLGDGTWLY